MRATLTQVERMRVSRRAALVALIGSVSLLSLIAAVPRAHGRPTAADLQPELWGEGLISTPLNELNTVFSPDGKELYWSVQLPDQSGAIVMSRLVKGKWTEPTVASFSG